MPTIKQNGGHAASASLRPLSPPYDASFKEIRRMSEPSIIVHGTELSGHAHRVVLLLRILGLPYKFVVAPPEVRRTPDFLKLNPLGQIPVLQDGPLVLADSNAIMIYVIKRYA